MAKLRLGILGAARIAPTALVVPIQTNEDLAEKCESTFTSVLSQTVQSACTFSLHTALHRKGPKETEL
jgi:hypothetical protein